MERDDDLDDDGFVVKTIEFGDELDHGERLHGRIVSIRCPDVGAAQ